MMAARCRRGSTDFALESRAAGEVISVDDVAVYAMVREAQMVDGEVRLVFDGGATAALDDVSGLRAAGRRGGYLRVEPGKPCCTGIWWQFCNGQSGIVRSDPFEPGETLPLQCRRASLSTRARRPGRTSGARGGRDGQRRLPSAKPAAVIPPPASIQYMGCVFFRRSGVSPRSPRMSAASAICGNFGPNRPSTPRGLGEIPQKRLRPDVLLDVVLDDGT